MTQEMLTTFDANARFAALAVSDDETRYFMDGIEIDEYGTERRPHYIATDGRRLHIARCYDEEFKTGFGWKPVKVLKTSADLVKKNSADYQFPNWKRVMPSDLEPESITIEIPENPLKYSKSMTNSGFGPFSAAIGNLVRWLPDDADVNIRFLSDLAGDAWTVRISENHQSLMLTSENGDKTVVIALMRRDAPVKTLPNGFPEKPVPDTEKPAYIKEPEPTPEPAGDPEQDAGTEVRYRKIAEPEPEPEAWHPRSPFTVSA